LCWRVGCPREDPLLGKFVRMAAMGVPPAAVRQKMSTEGVDAKEARRFELSFGLLSPRAAAVSDARAAGRLSTAEAAAAQEAAEPEEACGDPLEDPLDDPLEEAVVDPSLLREDPLLGKFVKMAAMGVPPPAVVNRMLVEGVPPAAVRRFKRSFGLPVTPTRRAAKPRRQAASRASAPLITVHWDALPSVRLPPRKRKKIKRPVHDPPSA
jgi:hypothetical protein